MKESLYQVLSLCFSVPYVSAASNIPCIEVFCECYMWQSHKIAVLSTYWRNCYHSFFFVTFRMKMIHSMFPKYFNVIGGRGQPLNYSCLCRMCSPHPIASAFRYEVVCPLIQKSQIQMAVWGELIALGHYRKRSKVRGNVVKGSGSTQGDARNAKYCVS